MKKKNVLPEGTRDLILDECVIKRQIERELDDMFCQWGYKEIITPTVEFYDTFNNDTKKFDDEELYKFFDNRGRILVLRPDMTVPISRVVETKFKDEPLPIKLRYNANEFRVHASFGGKRNEYTDCGVELIGLEDTKSDLEMLVLALEALDKLGLDDYKLEIGNIGFFKGAFETLEIKEEEKNTIAQYIEDKNLKSLEDYLNSLNMKDEYKAFFNKLPWLFGDKEVLKEAKELAFNEELKNNLNYLEELYKGLNELGYGDRVTFDLGMVARINYYTGIMFKGYGANIGNIVLSGGRYDNLIQLGGKNVPAIGFAVNINSVIETSGIQKETKKKTKVYYSAKDRIAAIKKSQELRKDGIIAELIPQDGLNEIKVEEI